MCPMCGAREERKQRARAETELAQEDLRAQRESGLRREKMGERGREKEPKCCGIM